MKHQKLTLVEGKRNTDCAVCAIATLTNLPYTTILKKLLPHRKPYTEYGATISDVENCFKKLKINVKKIICSSDFKLKQLKNHAFLCITVEYNNMIDLHAVVWDAAAQKILDNNKLFNKSQKYYQNNCLFCYEIINPFN